MSIRTSLAGAAVLGASLAVSALGTGTASAAVCDNYSKNCTAPPSSLAPTTTPPSSVSPAGQGSGDSGELPFTGGEIALASVLGLGALAGGTALVLAGRRRNHSAA